MRSLRLKRALLEEDNNVNLTPLIDVVFVVLIMFILVAPLLEKEEVELTSSSLSTKKEKISSLGDATTKIYVKKDNTILLGGSPIALSQLAAALKTEKKSHAERRLQVFHDRQAYFETYQAVKKAAEEGGFEEMDIMLSP